MLDKLSRITRPGVALIVCAVVSALLLAGAHGFERIGKLAPCALCLDQREVHWMVLGVVAIGGVGWLVLKSEKLLTATLGLIALVYTYSTFLSGYHAGVEWKFWPGPATCSAGTALITVTDPSDLLSQLDTAPIVSCTDAAWRMFGISMAGYNAAISLGLMMLAGSAAFRLAKQTGLVTVADKGVGA